MDSNTDNLLTWLPFIAAAMFGLGVLTGYAFRKWQEGRDAQRKRELADEVARQMARGKDKQSAS
jgi:hypothetical protein